MVAALDAYSEPNSLVLNFAEDAPLAGEYEVVTPPTLLEGGATLSYQLKVEGLVGGCSEIMLQVRVGDVIVDTHCGQTDGWVQRQVTIEPVETNKVQLSFVLKAGPDASSVVFVGLDDVILSGIYGCDDGNPCTLADTCVFGVCEGSPDPGCL